MPDVSVPASPPAPGADAVTAALREVYDPCCRDKGISVVDMGLVQSVDVAGGRAAVKLVLTSGWCPFAAQLLTTISDRVEQLPGVDRADVEVVWDEAWSTDRLSPDARSKLLFLPDPVAAGSPQSYLNRKEGSA
jgi:metal-sulfur cluster biosynthetic enzyme